MSCRVDRRRSEVVSKVRTTASSVRPPPVSTPFAMAAVLSPIQSDGMLQRRYNQAEQYPSAMNMGFVPQYGIPHGAGPSMMDPSQAYNVPRQFHPAINNQQIPMNLNHDIYHSQPTPGVNFYSHSTHVMPPAPAESLALDTSFAQGFSNPMNFNGSMSALPLQIDHNSGWPSHVNYMPMSAPASGMRTSSMSAFSSSPIIKSEEEHSPVQAQRMFYDASGFATSQPDVSSFDALELEGTNYSTDVDVLMKAIQSKGADEQTQQVCRDHQVIPFDPLTLSPASGCCCRTSSGVESHQSQEEVPLCHA